MWLDQRGSEILTENECRRLLALAAKEIHLGRLAVPDVQAPLLVPLNFTVHDNFVLVRIGPGRLSELASGSLVAFEVDHVEPRPGQAWSVLVRGLASPVAPGETPPDAWMPQPWVPEPGEQILAIRPDIVTGRRFRLVLPNGPET